MTAARPEAVAFDVVETLVSLEPVEAALAKIGAGAGALPVFFTRLVRDGAALAAAGGYRTFPEVAGAAFDALWPHLGVHARHAVLDAFKTLPAQPDAGPALQRLTEAGTRVAALTNGGADQTGALLQAAGLDQYIERVVSVDEVSRWKPAPQPYRRTAEVLSVPPGRLALVAVHSWDVHGAKRAGLNAGWAARLEGSFPSIYDPPDVTGADLLEVAEALLALPAEGAP